MNISSLNAYNEQFRLARILHELQLIFSAQAADNASATGEYLDDDGYDLDGFKDGFNRWGQNPDGFIGDTFYSEEQAFAKWYREERDARLIRIEQAIANGERTGTYADDEGYDAVGYDEYGYDRQGIDAEGYNRRGHYVGRFFDD